MKLRQFIFPIACVLSLVLIQGAVGDQFETETQLTPREFRALEKFKARVLRKIPAKSLVNKYAKDDLYMVRWLRAKNLDVNNAETMFLNHLKWREDQKMDYIDQEEFGEEFIKEFPSFTDTFGKDGEPIVEFWFGEWNVRRAVIGGKGKRLARFVTKYFEMTSRRLYDLRAEGKNVSQGIILVELEGFSIATTGCPSCLPIYLNLMNMFENHYPQMYEKLYLLNMPASFDIILRVVQPAMSRATRKALTSYVSKPEWLPVIEKKIDPDQRTPRHGGTLLREGFN